MAKKVIVLSSHSNSHNVDFKAEKKLYTAQKIAESFVDDAGEVIHILENGNTQSDASYMAVWGVKKSPVNWGCKGVNPNFRKVF